MKLHELHVLQRQPRAQHHGVAIAGAGVRRCTGKITAPVTAGGEDYLVRAETMQPACREINRDDAATGAVLHHQVDGEILDKEFGIVFQRLLVKGMQHRVTGAVRGGAGTLRDALAEIRRHAAERSLVNAPVLGARKGHAVVLEFDDGIHRFLAHVLDSVLVSQPVRALDRVVHVPAPVVIPHVGERRTNAALRCNRVAARREYLGDAGSRESCFGQAESRPQSGTAGTDDDNVITVINEIVVAHAEPPSVIVRMETTAASARNA